MPRLQLLRDSIEYWTDVEGNYDYLECLLRQSKAVFLAQNQLQLRDGFYFVHGGDTVDKGHGDIRVTRMLTSLKTRYPSRAFLILGNRDLNKLRCTSELAPGVTPTSSTAYWAPKCKSFAEFCEAAQLPVDDPVSNLKWMLDQTMGCQTTFTTRLLELEILAASASEDGTSSVANPHSAQIRERDVLDSFVSSVDPNSPDPWMLDLCRKGSIMVVIGDCVFLHGGLCSANLGKAPGTAETFSDIEAWSEVLNAWKDAQLAEFERFPFWHDPKESGIPASRASDTGQARGGDALMDYGLPNGAGNTTVIYQSWLEDGNCTYPEDVVVRYLKKNDVGRVIVGHVPHGDCPSVIRDASDVTVFLCDTSYSDMGASKTPNPANNRGAAASMLTLTSTQSVVSGVLASGEPHGYTLHTKASEDKLPDGLVGRQLKNGAWVKTIAQGNILTAKGHGYKLDIEKLSKAQVLKNIEPEKLGPLKSHTYGRCRLVLVSVVGIFVALFSNLVLPRHRVESVPEGGL